MKVRVLGCSGAIAKGCRTTSFLVDQDILVDAGTGVGDLTLDEMRKIDHVFLTHSHLDHIASLPLMLDAVASMRQTPVQIHALSETILALQQHVFNDVIWPDFSRLPSAENPFLQFVPLEVGDQWTSSGRVVEALPAIHTVPAVGYGIEGAYGWWIFSGDTGRNFAFWERVNELSVSALIMETAFGEREATLARRSMHLSPQTLLSELDHCIHPCLHVYISHTKPAETEAIMSEISKLLSSGAARGGRGLTTQIHWLNAGHEFNF
jgi:ribonuclease BN (tRNA processing enzyme)